MDRWKVPSANQGNFRGKRRMHGPVQRRRNYQIEHSMPKANTGGAADKHVWFHTTYLVAIRFIIFYSASLSSLEVSKFDLLLSSDLESPGGKERLKATN
jgi:hypothetical protein